MTRREWSRTVAVGAVGMAAGRLAEAAAQGPPAGRAYKYIHLDVFTNRLLTGNQLAVFLEPGGLDADTMVAMAREVNFSESTFIYPPERPDTDVRVRIFSRNAEMQFAGHPVIGTAFALAHAGRFGPGQARSVFGLGLGPTPVDLEWKGGRLAFAWMTQPLPTYGKVIDDVDGVAKAIGVEPDAIRGTKLPIQEVGCGSTLTFVPITSRQILDSAALNLPAMMQVYEKAGMPRRGVMVFSLEKANDDAFSYTRVLSATGTEDPATGSAAGPLGCYLAKHVATPGQAAHMISYQGVKIRRPSRLHLNITVTGGNVTGVRVGGESVVVGEGTIAV